MSIINLNFTVGHSNDKDTAPDKYAPANAPGNAQLDWANAENYPDFMFGENYKFFAWMEDVFWRYSAKIIKPELKNGERVFFISKGIDYEYEILLNGGLLLHREGMFTPVEIDLTEMPEGESILEIIIYPVPKAKGRARDRSEADECVKPPVSYGWDWHPRLIPSGLYEECYLEIKPPLYIADAEMRYELSDDLTRADIYLETIIANHNGACGNLRFALYDKNMKIACEYDFGEIGEEETLRSSFVFENPVLWWPNEQGDQVLYLSEFTLSDEDGNTDVKKSRVGFKRCALVRNEGASDRGFPKSADLPPITMEINNRRIFCKGSNWVEPEIFTGTINRDSYEPLIKLARDAHFNILRAWGGCMPSKESFFDLCDEAGLMIWQEFPLSCNNYKNNPNYLRVLDRESRSIIKRVRRHACLAIWCGPTNSLTIGREWTINRTRCGF